MENIDNQENCLSNTFIIKLITYQQLYALLAGKLTSQPFLPLTMIEIACAYFMDGQGLVGNALQWSTL